MPTPSHDKSGASVDDAKAERVARALRRQLAGVRARMEAHREIMEAAGLASPRPVEPERGSSPDEPRSWAGASPKRATEP